MKTLRAVFWGLVALCLILVGLANRDVVQLRAMPESFADLLHLSPTIEVPLFVAIFAGVALGLLIGFLWEWLRSHKTRSDARSKGREVVRLRQELSALRDSDGDGRDDVLQILEDR